MAGGAELSAECGGGAIGGEQRDGGIPFVAESVDFRKALVGAEEEGAVVKDGSADGSAELILLEVGARITGELREEIVGVEDVVADELPRRAVEVVGAGFADEVDVSAGAATVGCVEVGGLYAEFFDGVGRRH